MADRAQSEVMRLGPDVEVPDDVSVQINFGGGPIGRARLRRDDNGDIWADAVIVDERAQQMIADKRTGLRYFAVSVHSPHVDPGISMTTEIDYVPSGTVLRLAVTDANIDPGLPPFVIDAP